MSRPPSAVGQRAPTRSTSAPLTGERTIIATDCALIAMPARMVASGPEAARITGTARNVPYRARFESAIVRFAFVKALIVNRNGGSAGSACRDS